MAATEPWHGILEVQDLRPGDRFSLTVENFLHHPVTVRDCWLADDDTVRLHIDVSRYWRDGRIPVRVSVYREGE